MEYKNLKFKDLVIDKKHAIVDGPFGTQMKKYEFVDSGVPVIEMLNIKEDKFNPEFRRFITNKKLEEIKRSSVKGGDLIISKTGSLGYIAIVPKTVSKAIITSRLAKISFDWLKLNQKYLFYFLLFLRNNGYWEKIAKGTTMKILNIKQLAECEIPLPEIFEQQKIVEIIEELFSELDKGVESLKKAQQQFRTYRQAVLNAAFEGKILDKNGMQNINNNPKNGLSKNLKIIKSGEVINTINNGYTPKASKMFAKGDIPFIKVYNLTFSGHLDFTKKPTYISKETHNKELKRSIVYPNDVLINIVGPPLGKVSIVPNTHKEWNINQAIVLFRPNDKIKSKYLSYLLQSPKIIRWLINTSKATAGQYNVKVSTCREIPFPLYDAFLQEKIIEEIESRFSVCDHLEKTIEENLQKAESLRQSLLKQAFEGKLTEKWREENMNLIKSEVKI